MSPFQGVVCSANQCLDQHMQRHTHQNMPEICLSMSFLSHIINASCCSNRWLPAALITRACATKKRLLLENPRKKHHLPCGYANVHIMQSSLTSYATCSCWSASS